MKVLVLHISGLHLGFLGCYGNTWISTPHLDRLASDGIVFDQHHADNLNHRTCWTGQYRGPASPGIPVLHESLLSFSVPFIVCQPPPTSASSDATPLEQTLEAAVEALEGLAGQPRWLCWVDLPGLQPPWNVDSEFTQPYLAEESTDDEEGDEPFDPLQDPPIGLLDSDDLVLWERLRCTYAGAVTYLDAGLGLLLEEIQRLHPFDKMTIIVTSDRGLALGEHGMIGDWRPWLHEEVVHVPLIIRQPGAADAGQRISALTQSVDLAATLLDMFGVPMPRMDGRSWLPLLHNQTDKLRDHGISTWQLEGGEEWALRTPEYALVLPITPAADTPPRPTQLFVKPEDRWELNNVLQHHLELAEELEQKLRAQCSRQDFTTSLPSSSQAPPEIHRAPGGSYRDQTSGT